QPPLLAALGRPNLDTGAALLRKELGKRPARPRLGRDDDLRRDAGRAAVVLERERLEEQVEILAGDVLQEEAVPVGEATAAEREDLHGGAVVSDRDADHVHGPDRALVRRLALGEVPNRVEPVPVASGSLEVLLLGRPAHLLLELPLDRAGIAREELDHALDDLPVVLLRDVTDTRGQAAVDVVIEAGNARVPPRLWALTGPVREDAVEDVERLAHLLRVRVGAEVDDPATVPLAREHDARVVVLHRHGD